MSKKLIVQGNEITLLRIRDDDYISLSDMAKEFGGTDQIKNWIRTRSTIEYLGAWEAMNNISFNMVEYHHVRMEMASERFIISLLNGLKEQMQ